MTKKRSGEILVPQDGSTSAHAAAQIAIQIAKGQALSVHGLYVVDEALALDTYADHRHEVESSEEPVSSADLVAWLEEQGSAALQRLEIRCQAAGVPVTTELIAGGIPDMVLRASEQAQLLAIGRRGHGHEGEPSRLGQSFRTIAHRAYLPLVIGGDEERNVRRLLLAYDGTQHTTPALAWASSLQRTLPAEVAVVSVQENESQRAGEWWEKVRAQLPGCECLHRLGQPAGEIVAAAGETQADLIILGRYRHTALLEWLTGSTVDRVLRGTQLPVLMA